jgi:hypothetical protein
MHTKFIFIHTAQKIQLTKTNKLITSICRFPALSQLPESSRPEEAFALARVVANQDEHNCVFVAHDLEAAAQLVQEASMEDPGERLETLLMLRVG